MLTLREHCRYAQAGQGDVIAYMKIWDKWYSVLPLKIAAKKASMSIRYMQQKCDEGKLVSVKVGGTWWVAIDEYDMARNIA